MSHTGARRSLFMLQEVTIMDFAIHMTRQEIFETIRAFMPVRIALSDRDHDGEADRWVEIHDPRDLRIEPSEGVFLDFAMRIHWPLPLLPDDFTIRSVSGSLTPEIVCLDGSTSLALSLNVLELDIKNVPDAIDELIRNTVQQKLVAMQAKLVWKIAETMSVSIELPDWIDPRKVASIQAVDASVQMTPDAFTIRAPLELSLHTGEGKHAQISFGGAETLEDSVDLMNFQP